MSKIEITNEQLFEQLTKAVADAQAAAASANAAAANTSSAQSSTGAAGSAVNARTQSNTEQASTNDTVFKSVNQDSDIGIPEAWSANVKRTYDVHQTYDMETQARNRTHFDTMITQMQTHVANLNQMSIQALANNQNQSNLNNTLSIDRAWNINETDLAAKAAAILTDKVLAAAVEQAKG